MTTGIGPYVVPEITSVGGILEEAIHVLIPTGPADIDDAIQVNNTETLHGKVAGPTLRLNVGDTVIVRLVNHLPHPNGIHWHGFEFQNSAVGAPVTQDGTAVGLFIHQHHQHPQSVGSISTN